jgi:hypothetical protein
MNTIHRLTLTACAALALAACTPQPHLTTQQVQSVTGLSMGEVYTKLGRASSITNAGNSVWWEYVGITTANGNNDGACHVVFKNDVVSEIKC